MITKIALVGSITVDNKVYDGNTLATILTRTLATIITGDDVAYTGGTANFDTPLAGDNKMVTATGLSLAGTDKDNYTVNSIATTTANITKASTATTLTLSAASVRYMDNLTMTAKIVPTSFVSPMTTLTGTVQFKIGGVNYGDPVTVVPIPGLTDGSVQAMLIKQVSNIPTSTSGTNFNVEAIFTSTNNNYSGDPADIKTLLVLPRTAAPYNATGFYTGDGFAWTTGPNTSSASLTMTAVIKDANSPTGDVRGAKVSFYFVNGTTYTAIPSAQNLPVGLIDVTDGSVGAASAIVQLNIGSANAASFQIAIKVTGAYTNTPGDALSQTIVTVSKPIAGGFIAGGSNLQNINSSGYIMGAVGLNTDFEFDIQYTKSGTNPKGKVTIMVRSYYTKEGYLDSKLHTYLITTNAIASLNVGTPLATGTFSAKANLVEQLENLSTVAIEGGSTFQMVASQIGSIQQIAITLYRKAGGIWFSSNWDKLYSKTSLQGVNNGSHVYVSGGGAITSPTLATVETTSFSSTITGEASVIGNIISDGNAIISERGVVYGKFLNPTTSDGKVTNTGTTGSYTCTLTGLTANTTYYARAYAINSVGISYGLTKTITTLKSASLANAIAPVIEKVEPTLRAYPNPFTERLNIEFSSATDTQAKLEIYSITGAKLETLFDGPVEAGVVYFAEYVPHLGSSQMVFYHLTMDDKTQVGKVIYNK